MARAVFHRPVTVLVGLGFPKSITNAAEALGFLDDTPHTQRDAVHRSARSICLAAIQGSIDPELARDMVEAYAESRGILVDELLAEASLRVKEDLLSA